MIRRVLAGLGLIFGLAYPAIVYLGLGRLSARTLSLTLLALLGPVVAVRLWGAPRLHLLSVLRVPAVVASVLVLGAISGDARVVLALPALVNLALLVLFASTMWGERCMVERFALLEVSELSDDMVRYCRRVNVVWCAFFVINGAAAAVLAVTGPVSLWALYTGAVSYVLMGMVFTVEYAVRLVRFPELRWWRARSAVEDP